MSPSRSQSVAKATGRRPWGQHASWRNVLIAPLLAIAASCSSGGPTPQQVLTRANEAFAAEDYVKAEKDYREVLRLSPGEPTALRQLAIIYSDQGQLVQAGQLLSKVAEMRPDDAELQLRFGLSLLGLGERERAREAALKVLQQRAGDEQALVLLADSAATPQDLADVETLVQEMRAKDQDRAGYRIAIGILKLRQKDQGGAESELKTALELNPKSSQAYTVLGMLYWMRKDSNAAEDALKRASDLSAPRSPGRLLYADFKLRSGDRAQARALLEQIHKERPDALPPRVGLMNIACTQKRDDDCAARVKDILSQDSTNFDATLQNGILSLDKGDAPAAIRDFEYLSNIFRQNANIRYQLALAYLLSAKGANESSNRTAIETAERLLNEAISLNPLLEQAVLLFAELKIRRGNAAVAIDPLVRLTNDRPQDARAHYLLAAAYVAQKRNDQALLVYRRLTKQFPQDSQAHFLMGTLLLSERQTSEGRQAIETAHQISPDYLPAVEVLVELDIAEKRFEAGIDRVQKQIERNPDRAPLWILKAKLHQAQKDLSEAEKALLKAIELDDKAAPAYILLAQLYVASDRQQPAIEKLNASIQKNKTVPALLLLSAIHEQARNFSAARDAYEELLKIAPDFVVALNNLAVLYSNHIEQLDRAHELAKRARELSPRDPSIADTLGWVLFKRADYQQALRLLQESAGSLPDNPEVQFHLGLANYMLGEEQAARVALQKAANAANDFPGKAEIGARLKVLDIDLKDASEKVRSELQAYLGQRPNDPIALARLAAVQERDGAWDQAIQTYEQVLSQNPQYMPALRKLALLYNQRPGDASRMFEWATKARQAYPEDPEVAKVLGILTYRRELYPPAIELLRQAARKLPEDAELYYYLGDSYRRLKQWAECSEALERATSLKLPAAVEESAKNGLKECSTAL